MAFGNLPTSAELNRTLLDRALLDRDLSASAAFALAELKLAVS